MQPFFFSFFLPSRALRNVFLSPLIFSWSFPLLCVLPKAYLTEILHMTFFCCHHMCRNALRSYHSGLFFVPWSRTIWLVPLSRKKCFAKQNYLHLWSFYYFISVLDSQMLDVQLVLRQALPNVWTEPLGDNEVSCTRVSTLVGRTDIPTVILKCCLLIMSPRGESSDKVSILNPFTWDLTKLNNFGYWNSSQVELFPLWPQNTLSEKHLSLGQFCRNSPAAFEKSLL